MNRTDYTALLLAGGQSRRMGRPKAFLPWKDGTVGEHVLAAAAPLVERGLVVGTEAWDLPSGWTSCLDAVPQQGPVGGLATALAQLATPYALVLSCDLPLLTTAALRYLLMAHDSQKNAIFTQAARWQPLIGAYHRSAGAHFQHALALEERRLQRVVAGLPLQLVECPAEHAAALTNINTPKQYQHVYAAHH